MNARGTKPAGVSLGGIYMYCEYCHKDIKDGTTPLKCTDRDMCFCSLSCMIDWMVKDDEMAETENTNDQS